MKSELWLIDIDFRSTVSEPLVSGRQSRESVHVWAALKWLNNYKLHQDWTSFCLLLASQLLMASGIILCRCVPGGLSTFLFPMFFIIPRGCRTPQKKPINQIIIFILNWCPGKPACCRTQLFCNLPGRSISQIGTFAALPHYGLKMGKLCTGFLGNFHFFFLMYLSCFFIICLAVGRVEVCTSAALFEFYSSLAPLGVCSLSWCYFFNSHTDAFMLPNS